VELHPQKTRIVHVRFAFEFLGYKNQSRVEEALSARQQDSVSQARQDALYAYPQGRSRFVFFMDQVGRTKRRHRAQPMELIGEA